MLSRLVLLLAAFASALVVSGCGDDDGSGGGDAPAPSAPQAAKPADFPSAQGKATIEELTKGLDEGPILALAVSQLKVGRNRVAFALFDRARKQLDVDAVALYTAAPDGRGVSGPYVARKESLTVDTEYRSELTSADLASGDKFYVADVPFKQLGQQPIVGIARLDGRMVSAGALQAVDVKADGTGPPDVGDRAIKIKTLTESDVAGDFSKITTRIPPDKAMLRTNFEDVLGKKPVVLLFATPKLCASRTCGPVTDIAEQVRAQSGDGVAFIHQEVFVDNDPNKGYRKQMTDWKLPSEPWAFVIDRKGRISDRFEGVFSTGELARAVEKVK